MHIATFASMLAPEPAAAVCCCGAWAGVAACEWAIPVTQATPRVRNALNNRFILRAKSGGKKSVSK